MITQQILLADVNDFIHYTVETFINYSTATFILMIVAAQNISFKTKFSCTRQEN